MLINNIINIAINITISSDFILTFVRPIFSKTLFYVFNFAVNKIKKFFLQRFNNLLCCPREFDVTKLKWLAIYASYTTPIIVTTYYAICFF